jgi:hypothetical protein
VKSDFSSKDMFDINTRTYAKYHTRSGYYGFSLGGGYVLTSRRKIKSTSTDVTPTPNKAATASRSPPANV